MHAPDAGEVRGNSDQATGPGRGGERRRQSSQTPRPDQSPDTAAPVMPDDDSVAGPIPGDPHDGDSGEDHPPMAVTQQEPVTTPGHEDEKPTCKPTIFSVVTASGCRATQLCAGMAGPGTASRSPPQPTPRHNRLPKLNRNPKGPPLKTWPRALMNTIPSASKSRAAADLFDRSRLRPVAPDDHPNIAVHLATRIRLTVDPDDPVLQTDIEPTLIRLLEKAARCKPGQSALSPESLAARITSLPNLRGEALLIAEAIDRALSAPPSAGPPEPLCADIAGTAACGQ